MPYKKQFPAKNQDGLVALFVVSIMIILLSLTTLAFTKLMSRESQQSLDRVLSTQAYYSAQSGINDARDFINNHPQTPLTTSNCDTFAQKGYPPYLGPAADGDVNKITCVVADTAPNKISFNIPAGRSRIFELNSVETFDRILFSWDNENGGGNMGKDYKLPNSTDFPDSATWDRSTAPVLEVTYYPVPDAGDNLPNLLSYGRTIFLYPSKMKGVFKIPVFDSGQPNGDGSIIYNTCDNKTAININGLFVGASSTNHCNTVVYPSIQPGGAFPHHVFVKVSAYYSPATLLVFANRGGPGEHLISIQNVQAVLDSTGKGGPDVLKRLQTVVDYRPADVEPGDTIETAAGLCKRLELNLTTGNPQVDDPFGDPATFSQACHTSDLP